MRLEKTGYRPVRDSRRGSRTSFGQCRSRCGRSRRNADSGCGRRRTASPERSESSLSRGTASGWPWQLSGTPRYWVEPVNACREFHDGSLSISYASSSVIVAPCERSRRRPKASELETAYMPPVHHSEAVLCRRAEGQCRCTSRNSFYLCRLEGVVWSIPRAEGVQERQVRVCQSAAGELGVAPATGRLPNAAAPAAPICSSPLRFTEAAVLARLLSRLRFVTVCSSFHSVSLASAGTGAVMLVRTPRATEDALPVVRNLSAQFVELL